MSQRFGHTFSFNVFSSFLLILHSGDIKTMKQHMILCGKLVQTLAVFSISFQEVVTSNGFSTVLKEFPVHPKPSQLG